MTKNHPRKVVLDTNTIASALVAGDRFAYVILSSKGDFIQFATCTREGYFRRDGESEELRMKNPNCPVRIDSHQEDDESRRACPSCGGTGTDLGSLGSTQWLRCRDCGLDFNA